MCGIAGLLNFNLFPNSKIKYCLKLMDKLLAHRGPDGNGTWISDCSRLGFSHRRLSIIDLSINASQPMIAGNGNAITFNGEIYNYKTIQKDLSSSWEFKSLSDTECILALYDKYGLKFLNYLNGMFAFAIWDNNKKRLICATDRFGIKPIYYIMKNDTFMFASEAKALLPFINDIALDEDAFSEYLTFQYNIGENTMFRGIKKLLPGHYLIRNQRELKTYKYWDIKYDIDYSLKMDDVKSKVNELVTNSVKLHSVADVPIASYISGGLDSSILLKLLSEQNNFSGLCFHGNFANFDDYDESFYAKSSAKFSNSNIKIKKIKVEDFISNFENLIYHLDLPIAGPGAFPQFMVSKEASKYVKSILGGHGGDELFGGYARYLIAYFEQCIKASIDGNYKNGNFIVTIESIIPNLETLKQYKPLIKNFWSKGLFDEMSKRYFKLIDKSSDMKDEIEWNSLDKQKTFNTFLQIFDNPENTEKEAYFDKMTHFDFKCLLPALLHVEDRVSMAHGIETRVPFLEHNLVEYLAKIPADIKFKNGNLKNLLSKSFENKISSDVFNRKDKMGFPVPLKEWFSGNLKEFVYDNLNNMSKKHRPFINGKNIVNGLGKEKKFSRKYWALLSLEIWFQQFFDNFKYNSKIHNFKEI